MSNKKNEEKVCAAIFTCNLNTGRIKHRRTNKKYEYILKKYEAHFLDNI